MSTPAVMHSHSLVQTAVFPSPLRALVCRRYRNKHHAPSVHDFHGSADNPSLDGTLRHPDIDLALSQRAKEKLNEIREGYAAPGLRHRSRKVHTGTVAILLTIAA